MAALPSCLLWACDGGRDCPCPLQVCPAPSIVAPSEGVFSAVATAISPGCAKPYVRAVCELGSSCKAYRPVPGMIKWLSLLICFSCIYRHFHASYFWISCHWCTREMLWCSSDVWEKAFLRDHVLIPDQPSEVSNGLWRQRRGRWEKIAEKLQERKEVCNPWQCCFWSFECRTL